LNIKNHISFHFAFHLVLSKLLTTLNEGDNKLSGEQELQFLQSLLQSKEINALVNVHTKVAKMGKDDRIAPILSASMQARKTINFLFNKVKQVNLIIFIGRFRNSRGTRSTMPHFTTMQRTISLVTKTTLTEFDVCTRCCGTKRFLSPSTRYPHRNGK
jgi:hypothetical protein